MGEVDLVIDHHPEETPTRARLRDVRPSYGATSTILTEYLRAADVKIRERLATALLYGIKTDTLHLERGATRADMEAFAYLHAHANHNALRRIERPDLPEAALDVLAKGIARRRLVDGVMLVHLGAVGYPELVAQFADLLLQVEGAEWSVVSGRIGAELHISVRNVGYVRAAGDVVHDAFGELGSAGGHRSMAKAVVRLRDWRGGGPAHRRERGGRGHRLPILEVPARGRRVVVGRDRPPHRVDQGRARRRPRGAPEPSSSRPPSPPTSRSALRELPLPERVHVFRLLPAAQAGAVLVRARRPDAVWSWCKRSTSTRSRGSSTRCRPITSSTSSRSCRRSRPTRSSTSWRRRNPRRSRSSSSTRRTPPAASCPPTSWPSTSAPPWPRPSITSARRRPATTRSTCTWWTTTTTWSASSRCTGC